MLKLNLHSIRTDNFDILSKINLRREATENIKDGKIKVLDLFAGENKLWKNFQKEKYFGVEKEKGKGKNLYGDNIKIIPTLDLSQFNVIDCDSYGIPYEQIFLIFKNKTLCKNTVVLYTCITNRMSNMSKLCIQRNNLDKIYKKTRTIMNGKSIAYFYNLLIENGINVVREYEIKSNFIKKYGYFII